MSEKKVAEAKGIDVTTLTDIELAKHISDAMTQAAQVKEQATVHLMRLSRNVAALQDELAKRTEKAQAKDASA